MRHVRWRTEGGNEVAAVDGGGGGECVRSQGKKKKETKEGQMGRLEHLRPARIAKRMGQGQARSFCPLRARGSDVARCPRAP